MNIFDILKLLNMTNQTQNTNTQNVNNPALNNYPSDAFTQSMQNSSNNGGDNNIFPLLMSMLGKGGDLSKIFTQNTNKKEEVKKESTSPKDEILL